MNSKPILLGIFSCLTSASCTTQTEVEQPNFIIIFTDDQGYEDLGCYGSPLIKTPRIDQMAEEGMRFTSFYAQTISGPSRTSLMTGCYPVRTARVDNDYVPEHPTLSLSEITVAEILKERGYTNCIVGKWDLAGRTDSFKTECSPIYQGFDDNLWAPRGNSPGFIDLYVDEDLVENKPDLSQLTKRYTDYAIEFMERNHEDPFFLYIAHTMPHEKLAASEEFEGISERGLYGDVIEEIDYNVGRILDKVKELGLDDNTYIIYTSDNGPWWVKGESGGCAAPLRGGKTSTWEGGMRVPCIVRAPGRVPAGIVSDQVSATIDILPTFASLIGASIPTDRVIDGVDLSEVWHGSNKAIDRSFFYYQHLDLRAVRHGKWKLHQKHSDVTTANKFARHVAPEDRVIFKEHTLYDLDSDIGESTNVADQHPDVVARLLKELEWASRDIGNIKDGQGENARRE